MGFRVFGSAEVLSVHSGADQAAISVRKQAHRAVFSYVPRDGYVYVRSRAISSRCNDNFDFFGAQEIEKAYQTFIGKPVFVNHHNSDHKQLRGVIIDAALHRDRNPDGSPDTWAEVLMEVDGKTYPKLAKALINGDIDRTSMGVDVQISKCSACGNEAKSPLEYCRHVPGMKGKRIFQLQPDGRKVGKLVYEECYGLSFFENSLLVEPPADPTALRLGQVVVGAGLEHLLAKSARLTAAVVEPDRAVQIPSMQRIASRVTVPEEMTRVNPADPLTVARQALAAALRKQSGFLDDYPSDDEVDKRREGGFGGGDPWVPYKHQLASRPEPREAHPAQVAVDTQSREHGTTYKRVLPGTKGALPASSPDDEYHGPYEVIKHPDTGMHHVVDNQGRIARYGPHEGMADRHQAEYMRDYADHRQGSKERAKGIADKLMSGMHEIFDPGGTEESRESERKTRGMNNLLNLGYHPHEIKFDDGDEPYGRVSHPSGWHTRDSGGIYVHLHHDATGDEAHDLINVGRNDSQSGRQPGYGPAEAKQDLDHWHSGDPEETGGNRQHLEQSDPRIRRWKMQHGASLRTAADEPKKLSKPDQFFKDNPVNPQHLVTMFKQASPSQHAEGMDWYQHMHRTARMITGGHVDRQKGDVVGGNPALGAGLLANYSQQSSLSDNHWKASTAVLSGHGVWSGNHPGMFAGQEQAGKADRMMAGEHHSTVLGAPKTRNFAHLIEHGGNGGASHAAVCVDRHALSAAIGRRANDEDFATANLSAKPKAAEVKDGHTENHRYRMVADAYRHASSQLSEETGQHIEPHHVQAVTWVMQRDQNAAAEAKETDPSKTRLIKGRTTKNTTETARWRAHVAENYPDFADQSHWKMTKLQPRQAYGETRAPQNVNTLRNESCEVCSNDVAFDGRECQVCGFIAPPKALGDPDVDKARQLDQLKDTIEDNRDESGADPSQPGADFDAGDTDQDDPGGDNSANPWLGCPNCGTEMRPTAPQTASTTAPPGSPSASGPAEGDVCPVCQKGQLASTGTSENQTDDEELEQADQDQGNDTQDPAEDEDPGADASDDDDEPPPAKKKSKNPAGQATAAMKYRDHQKGYPMNNALRALAAQQQAAEDLQTLVDHQQRTIALLHQRLAGKDRQVKSLSAGLTVIARHLGVEVETMVRSAMVRKTADEQNPAQPIPEPMAQPPAESTVDAKTPEAFADVRMPGMVPGANQDVAADAVTTAYTPGQDIATPPLRQLVDVTAPVAGTQGPRPINEVKTNVDVRAGNTMNPQVAFPLNGPYAQAQRTGAAQGESNDLRTMASIRLARLQLASGIAQGDDLTIGQKIASDVGYSMERINQEIATLNQIRTAASSSNAPMPPRGTVPRSAGTPVQRVVPPLSMTASAGSRGASSDDIDVEAIFI